MNRLGLRPENRGMSEFKNTAVCLIAEQQASAQMAGEFC